MHPQGEGLRAVVPSWLTFISDLVEEQLRRRPGRFDLLTPRKPQGSATAAAAMTLPQGGHRECAFSMQR